MTYRKLPPNHPDLAVKALARRLRDARALDDGAALARFIESEIRGDIHPVFSEVTRMVIWIPRDEYEAVLGEEPPDRTEAVAAENARVSKLAAQAAKGGASTSTLRAKASQRNAKAGGRPRIYATNAEKCAAYRARKKGQVTNEK